MTRGDSPSPQGKPGSTCSRCRAQLVPHHAICLGQRNYFHKSYIPYSTIFPTKVQRQNQHIKTITLPFLHYSANPSSSRMFLLCRGRLGLTAWPTITIAKRPFKWCYQPQKRFTHCTFHVLPTTRYIQTTATYSSKIN